MLYNDDTLSTDPDSVEFFVYNAVGHTVALSDYSSAVTQSTVYEAFGQDVAQSGTSTNNRLRNTKERDASLGLDNDGFRYYDPATGRYIQRDPIGYGDGMNVYQSVDNDPVNSVDPVGLRSRAAKKPDTGVRAGWSFQQYKQERAEIVQRIAYDRQVNGGAGKDAAFLQSRLHALDMEAERGKALGAPKRAAKAVRDVVDSGYTPGEQEMSTYEKGARAVVSLHPVGRGGLAAIDATTHIVERSADGVSVMDVGGAVVAGADNLGGGGGKKIIANGVKGSGDDVLKAGVKKADNVAANAAESGAKAAGKAPEGVRGGPYGHLPDHPSVNSGKPFTASQKQKIVQENKKRNDGKILDDDTGEELVPHTQSRTDSKHADNEVHIDHEYPRSEGGPNSFANAKVRSRANNMAKSNKIED